MRVKKELFQNHVKDFPPGATIFREGERGEELYVIMSGEVEIRKSTYTVAARTISVMSQGDIFGEMALIEKKARSATAVALKQTKLLVINERLFENVIDTNPDFAKKMIRLLSERLRKANSILKNLIVTSRENQVVKGLFQYAENFGTPTFSGFRIDQTAFIGWAGNHLGIREQDMNSIIQNLLRKQTVSQSVIGKQELILKTQY